MLKNYDNIKIAHTMKDGTTRDSAEGYEIPYDDTTAAAYNLLAKWAMDKKEK